MVDLTKITFREFNDNIDNFHNRLELIIDDGDWFIFRDKLSSKYFVNAPCDMDFYEVKPVAKLEYDVLCDVQYENKVLFDMFDWNKYDFCGEQVTDDKIFFWWFKEVV